MFKELIVGHKPFNVKTIFSKIIELYILASLHTLENSF